MVSYKGDLYKLLLVQDMAAPTIPVSAEENLRDPIDIKVDIIHSKPVATVALHAAAVLRTQAQHGEAIRGILEHLQGVPIEEEISTLRFRMGMAEAENASLRGRIKTMEAIETKGDGSKPRKMQDQLKYSTELMGKKISTLVQRQTENKRKLDNNNQAQQQPPKKQCVAIADTAGPGEKKEYAGTLLLCNKSKYRHMGSALSDCPERKNQNHENQTGGTVARGVVHAL
ncbi:hypothetical protein Tco_0612192 [Tanacetum coccineum]